MRGIYAITNILTDTVYYGQARLIEKRLQQHKSSLKLNNHHNKHLQNSWNKHGKDAFVFTPIQIIDDNSIDLTPIEKKYKDNAYNLGLKIFNIREPEMKAPLSEETKIKISLSKKGRPQSEIHKINLGKVRKGNKNALGHKLSETHKNKQSDYMKKDWSSKTLEERKANTLKANLAWKTILKERKNNV